MVMKIVPAWEDLSERIRDRHAVLAAIGDADGGGDEDDGDDSIGGAPRGTPAQSSSRVPVRGVSFSPRVWVHHVGSMVGAFAPQQLPIDKPAPPWRRELVVKHLPAHYWVYRLHQAQSRHSAAEQLTVAKVSGKALKRSETEMSQGHQP